MARATQAAKVEENFESPIPDAALPALHAIVVASAVANGYLWFPSEQAEVFAAAGFIQIHPEAKDGDAVAVVITEAGKTYAEAHPAVADEDYTAGVGDPMAELAGETKSKRKDTGFKRPDTFEIDTGVVLPPVVRGGGGGGTRESAYPFDKLEVGQSFHIAATAANDDPAKSVASSVSTVNLKYRPVLLDENGKPKMELRKYKHRGEEKEREFEVRGEATKEFTVRSVDASDPKGKGCRVWRVK